MDCADRHKVSALFFVEVVKVRSVLEVVCVYGAVLNNGVGNYIVVVGLNIESYAFFGENLLCNFENFGVRCGRSRNGYSCVFKCVIVNVRVVSVTGISTTLMTEPLYLSLIKFATCLLFKAAARARILGEFSFPSLVTRILP